MRARRQENCDGFRMFVQSCEVQRSIFALVRHLVWISARFQRASDVLRVSIYRG